MSSSENLLKTPLSRVHEEAGARMVEFGGWLMPVQYSGIIQEHRAVRKAAGLFDISHMGEVYVWGPKAESWLNKVLSNDVRKLEVGQGQYTLMLFESGGVLDDLILYRITGDGYLLVVNASMIAHDAAWLKKHLEPGVELLDASADTGGLALQGPKSISIAERAFPEAGPVPSRNHIRTFSWRGHETRMARTGYTGEDGIELFFPASASEEIWKHILATGREDGCVPVGLGARDTLRLEACLPLNGHELGPNITPLEAGLQLFFTFSKPEDFIGQEGLERMQEEGVRRKLVAFSSTEGGAPPRAGYPIFVGAQQVGEVTSGGMSPTLGKGIGLALVARGLALPGTELEMEVRGKRVPITLQKKPLYRKS